MFHLYTDIYFTFYHFVAGASLLPCTLAKGNLCFIFIYSWYAHWFGRLYSQFVKMSIVWSHFVSFNRVDTRCDKDNYDCRDRNPCDPERCTEGQDMYTGHGRLKYVQCTDQHCNEVMCPRGSPFDEEKQECVPLKKPKDAK